MGGAEKIQQIQFVTATSFSLAMVDVIFADVAQPDQTRIVALNAHTFLRNGGHFVISIKVRGLVESKVGWSCLLCNCQAVSQNEEASVLRCLIQPALSLPQSYST